MGRRPLAYRLKETIGDIYDRIKQRQKDEAALREKEFAKMQEENLKEDQLSPLTKEEKIQANLNALESIATEITGEDLEFGKKKKKKNRYKKWIMSEDLIEGENNIATKQIKKKKKHNYNKEFEPEISRLKNLLAEQSKMKSDLLKRFNLGAGPATKDGGRMDKTLVELASVINEISGSELSTMKEIGTVKKVIAELYIKQQQLEAKKGDFGGGDDATLMGSDLANSILNQQFGNFTSPTVTKSVDTGVSYDPGIPQQQVQPEIQVSNFDPSTWSQPQLVNDHIKYEGIPHNIVVEYNKTNNTKRYKAVDAQTGQELPNCPVPTYNIKSFDESKMQARDDLGQTYNLEIIGQ